MREHKYRAWNKRLGKMQQMTDIALDPEFGGVLVWGKAYTDHDTGEHEADKDFWPWYEIELMQYTGLKDREGKEVYEGDIVKGNNPWDTHGDTLQVVKYVDGTWNYSYALQEYAEKPERDWEVIGNLYEHPHLLEEVKREH